MSAMQKDSGLVAAEESAKPNNPLQSNFDPENSSIEDEDERILRGLGYKQSLHRQWKFFESFAASFAALYSVGGIRTTFTIGVGAGGPVAYWSSYLITCFFVFITAAVLAEVCSALPAAGSIYFWASASVGRKWARLAGFIVAFWTVTAWTSFVAANCQAAANFILSEITVYGLDFTTDPFDIDFRAVQWIVAEVILCISLSMNYFSPKSYSWIFKIATYIILLDFFLNIIWLPIAVSRSYGFQDSSYLLTQINETGADDAWNWQLSFFVTGGILVGFEASGHISEETAHAQKTAPKGIFWSAVASALIGLPLVFLFLMCLPDLDSLYALGAPQPFVQVYALSMGDAHIFMTIICVLGLIFNTTVAGVASSRLIWAIARDGVLPFSGWISAVSSKKEPRNAIIFMHVVAALLLCTILPSPVAFTSLISAAGVPTITAYTLIAFGMTFIRPNELRTPQWSLGKFSRPFAALALIWNLYLSCVLFSPLEFPVTGETFNYSPVIFGAITLFGIIAWAVIPEERWLPNARLDKVHQFEETIAVAK